MKLRKRDPRRPKQHKSHSARYVVSKTQFSFVREQASEHPTSDDATSSKGKQWAWVFGRRAFSRERDSVADRAQPRGLTGPVAERGVWNDAHVLVGMRRADPRD